MHQQSHELERKKTMGCEQEHAQSPILKLSLYSLPTKKQEPPGMLTPPLQTQVAIPFGWEEVPGKPKAAAVTAATTAATVTAETTAATVTATQTANKPKAARCLELPPRLLLTDQAKVTNMPSPTTVLDGPYVSRSLSSTFSFRKGGGSILSSVDSFGKRDGKAGSRGVLHFGSWRWGDLKENRDVLVGSLDFSPLSGDDHELVVEKIVGGGGGDGGDHESDTKVKITRVKKRGSFMSVSHTKSHLWANIYESLKQVVPWRRMRQRKIEKEEMG